MNLTLAVVIPVYNRPTAVGDALASVASQTFTPARLIIVDDGSTDDTPQRVEQWLQQNKPSCDARLIRQINAGPAAARNRGVRESGECDLLAFLDSDDLWPADFLQRMIAAFADNPTAVAASCDKLNVDENRQSQLRSARPFQGIATTRLFLGSPPGMPATVVRAAAFRQLGGFDASLRFTEDYHFLLRLSLLGAWLYVPGAPLTRRLLGDAAQSKKFDERALIRARMMDRFIHDEGGAAAVPARLWKPRLAQLWYRAGRMWLSQGSRDQARDCFQRAGQLNPFHARARLRTWIG